MDEYLQGWREIREVIAAKMRADMRPRFSAPLIPFEPFAPNSLCDSDWATGEEPDEWIVNFKVRISRNFQPSMMIHGTCE